MFNEFNSMDFSFFMEVMSIDIRLRINSKVLINRFIGLIFL